MCARELPRLKRSPLTPNPNIREGRARCQGRGTSLGDLLACAPSNFSCVRVCGGVWGPVSFFFALACGVREYAATLASLVKKKKICLRQAWGYCESGTLFRGWGACVSRCMLLAAAAAAAAPLDIIYCCCCCCSSAGPPQRRGPILRAVFFFGPRGNYAKQSGWCLTRKW